MRWLIGIIVGVLSNVFKFLVNRATVEVTFTDGPLAPPPPPSDSDIRDKYKWVLDENGDSETGPHANP